MAKPGLKRPAKAKVKAKPKPTPGPKATKRPAKAEQGAKNPKAPSLRGVVSSLSKAIDLKSRSLKVLYLLRGAPGCGKSSVARLLLQKHLKAQGVSWNASSAGEPRTRPFAAPSFALRMTTSPS
ncbi:unnamed protein product [Effrenium voratum]|uniref:Uncharacterized protein n=1 Tax=Effrenium voratum TaxID=2562239 RepID=A0AA36MGW3_9DINO|nr:unnamed protein product [Effrenium voratum]